jgi:hypothetical protein
VALELLAWDVARVSAHEARGFDVTVYRARQAKAAELLEAGDPVEQWPPEIVALFMAVLEVSMEPSPVHQRGIGPLSHPVARRDGAGKAALRVAAAELGVLENLREVAPLHWTPEERR